MGSVASILAVGWTTTSSATGGASGYSTSVSTKAPRRKSSLFYGSSNSVSISVNFSLPSPGRPEAIISPAVYALGSITGGAVGSGVASTLTVGVASGSSTTYSMILSSAMPWSNFTPISIS